MSLVSLGHLFASGRDEALPVALQGDMVRTLGAFTADVAALAATLRARCVQRVAVVSADGYRFAVGLFAALQAGACAVVPPNGLPGTLETIGRHADVLCSDEPMPAPIERIALIQDAAGTAALPALDPRAATIEFFTSGSTGTPKRVAKSLWEVDHDLTLFERLWGDALAGAVTYGTVTHHHFYGLTFRVLWPLAAGRAFAAEIDEFWEPLLARLRPASMLVTSPGHALRLAGVAPLPAARRLRQLFCGGAPLPLAAAHEVRDLLGVLPTEMYGSTETGPIGTRQQHGPDEPWQVVPGLAVGQNDEGCAVVRWPDAPEMAPFVTADRIEILADGRFRLLGRADLIVKIEGKRVSLPEVEAVLQRSPLVAEAAAIELDGTPTQLAAVVVLSEAGRAEHTSAGSFRLGRTLRRALAGDLEAAAQPKRWRFVAALPTQGLGKRDTAAMRALFAERQKPPR